MPSRLHILSFTLFILLHLSREVFGQLRITSASFISGTSEWNQGDDGVISVTLSDRRNGLVCNLGLSNTVAAVMCYQLGFENKGVIQRSSFTSTLTSPMLIQNVICSTVTPGDPSSYTFDRCSVQSPTTCNRNNALSIRCGARRTTVISLTGPTVNPFGTLAPVNCSSSSTSPVRLVNGTATSGRVELFYNGTWGTICNVGFYQNAAQTICNMLCQNSKNARAVVGNYPPGNGTIWISNLVCPVNVSHIDRCTHSPWGKPVAFCNHGMDARVECAPAAVIRPTIPNPNLTCNDAQAIVEFNKSANMDLTKDMLKLLNASNYDATRCKFNVTINATHIVATFQFTQCGGNVTFTSNSTSYRINLLRIYKPTAGLLYTANYSIPIICVVPKINQGNGGNIAPQSVTVPPKTGTDKLTLQLGLYRDAGFTQQILPNTSIVLNTIIYVRVQETAKLRNNQMAVRDCWATESSNRDSRTRKELIVKGCPQTAMGVHQIRSIDAMTQSFSFNAFVFSGSATLYVHCNTVTCHVSDPNANCRRTCTGGRKKRSIPTEWEQLLAAISRKFYAVDQGPFYVTGSPVGQTNFIVPSILLVVSSVVLHML